jgi:hypothetical protein
MTPQQPSPYREPTGITLLKCKCGNDSFRVIETADYLVDLGVWEGNETIRLCNKCGRQVGCFNDLSGNPISREELLLLRDPSHSSIQQEPGQQEYRITDEELQQMSEIDYGNCDVARRVVLRVRSRPIQASQDSNLNEQEPGELEYGSILPNGEDWRLRRCDAGMGETEYRIFRNEVFFAQFDNRKDADMVMGAMTHRQEREQQSPTPPDEQCRICEQAIRKDEREQWKKGILKFTEEDPLLMAYAEGYKAGKKDATGKVLDKLDELRKYANGEYKEADCSDNEREMRIHLEYENRVWGIMREFRKGRQE